MRTTCLILLIVTTAGALVTLVSILASEVKLLRLMRLRPAAVHYFIVLAYLGAAMGLLVVLVGIPGLVGRGVAHETALVLLKVCEAMVAVGVVCGALTGGPGARRAMFGLLSPRSRHD